MLRYILRRAVIVPIVFILIVSLAFAYAHTVQWDYARRYPQLYRRMQNMGRPEMLKDAFRLYLQDLREFNLGTLRNGKPIIEVVRDAAQASLGLLLVALLFSVPMGILLGIAAGHWNRLRPARWLTMLSTAGLAMPSFYAGSLLILLSVAYALWIRSAQGLPFPLAGFGWDRHMVFPVLALMVRPTVQIAQVTGTLLTDELHKPYVAAARSLGHSWQKVKRRLAFRNILAPVVLTVAGSLRTLVADLVLVEWLFFWPGLGRFLAAALIPASRTDMASSPYLLDPHFVAAILGAISLIFLVADFVAAVLVRIFDPRLRVPVSEEVANV